MATDTTQTIITKIEDAMANNPGVSKLIINGREVNWDLAQMMEQLEYFQRKLAAESGTSKLGIKFVGIRTGAAN